DSWQMCVFFLAEDGIRDFHVTGVQTCALPISTHGELRDLLLDHLEDHYSFYGEYTGVRTARKHIGWYFAHLTHAKAWLASVNRIESTQEQLKTIAEWFSKQDPHAPFTHEPVAA